MTSKNLDFLNWSPHKGQHQKSLFTLENRPRIYSGMLMYALLKRQALVEEIHNTASEAQIIVNTVCEIRTWASSSSVFVSVRQFTVCLSEDDSSSISQIRISVSNFIMFLPFLGNRLLLQSTVPRSASVFIPVLQYGSQKTASLCAVVSDGGISLTNLNGDTRFNLKRFSDCVRDWVVYDL